jgi:hypothetical protein
MIPHIAGTMNIISRGELTQEIRERGEMKYQQALRNLQGNCCVNPVAEMAEEMADGLRAIGRDARHKRSHLEG